MCNVRLPSIMLFGAVNAKKWHVFRAPTLVMVNPTPHILKVRPGGETSMAHGRSRTDLYRIKVRSSNIRNY